MIRALLSVGLALHGLIHLIGFVVPWRLANLQGFPYSTTATWGRIDLGDGGARVLGLGWLFATLAFLVAATGTWNQSSWAPGVTAVAAIFSIALCILGSPSAVAGIAINGVILAAILYVELRHSGLASSTTLP